MVSGRKILVSALAVGLMLLVVSCGDERTTSASTLPPVTTLPYNYTDQGYFDLNVTPSQSVAVGQTIHILPANTTSYQMYYTFTQISPTQPYATITPASDGGVDVTSQYPMSLVLQIEETSPTDGSVYSYTTITLTFTGTTSSTLPLTCTLSMSAGPYYQRNAIYFYPTAATGEALLVRNWDPGEVWAYPPTFPMNAPLVGYYSSGGTKTTRIWAESISRPGVPCNGGQPLSASFVVN